MQNVLKRLRNTTFAYIFLIITFYFSNIFQTFFTAFLIKFKVDLPFLFYAG